jgi:hypothetical protein
VLCAVKCRLVLKARQKSCSWLYSLVTTQCTGASKSVIDAGIMAIALTPALQIASIVSSTFYSLWNLFAVRVKSAVIHAVLRWHCCAFACTGLIKCGPATWHLLTLFLCMRKGFIITWGSQPWYLRWYYYLDPGQQHTRKSSLFTWRIPCNDIWQPDG